MIYGNPGVWGTAGPRRPAPRPSPYTPNNPYGTVYRGFPARPPVKGTFGPGKPVGPQPAQGPAPAAPPPYPDLAGLNYSSDPVLRDVISGGESQLSAGRARKLERQKQLLLAFGSQEMARKLLGDDPFVNTVSADPYTAMSSLALSRRAEIDQSRDATEQLNANGNLFFSSHRGQTLAEVARQRMLRDYQATNEVQSGLGALNDEYTGLEAQVMAARRAAEQEAYSRAIQEAIAKWWSAPAGGGASSAAAPPPGGAYSGADRNIGRRMELGLY